MSANLQQFYEGFFEESLELLAEMEKCLLGLDVNAPNVEDLNAIFRVAHSIKGGAGAFGFVDMVKMTHMLESLLDKLRKGEIVFHNEMIDSFLIAGDVIKGQLTAHRAGGKADTEMVALVCEELRKFSEQKPVSIESSPTLSLEPVSVRKTMTVASETIDASERSVSKGTGESTAYIIQFSTEGMNSKALDNVFSNIGDLGAVERLVSSDDDQICKLRLITYSSEEAIWEAMAFIVNPEYLTIEVEALIKNDTDAMLTTDQNDNEAREDSSVQTSRQQKFHRQNNPTAIKKQPKTAAAFNEANSIRVNIEKVDHMINLVGELIITQAALTEAASEVDPALYEKLFVGMKQLERNTRDLQEAVMSIRMLPVSFLFSRFPRVIRDIAVKLNKQVELKMIGEGSELDKGLIEKMTDPLTHLVRNSLDHGIELPEVRIAAGKPAKGTITLHAFHQGGSIVIEVSDDGAGLNRKNILDKARERGLPASESMSDQEVWMLIFEAGISTAAVVTDVSGRGVGMDVVKRNVQSMGGRIEINSVSGVGTSVTIRLPLTLAILDGLSVSVGDQIFIVPLTYIVESLQPAAEDLKTIRNREHVVLVRGEYLPVIALHELFHIRPKSSDIEDGILVILDAEGKKIAMFVDALIGQHQVVIKSLENNFRRVQGISGATILGNGRVALILDAAGLLIASQQLNARIA